MRRKNRMMGAAWERAGARGARAEALERRLLLTAAVSFDGGHIYDRAGFTANSIAQGNFNGDANPDVAVVSLQQGGNPNIDILLGNGDATFRLGSSMSVAVTSPGLRIGDYNGDGRTDVILEYDQLENNHIQSYLRFLPGNGDGTVQQPIGTIYAEGASMDNFVVADMDQDGKADLVTSGVLGLFVKHSNGDGTFTTILSDSNVSTVYDLQARDVNGDGRLDLVFGYTSNGVGYVGVRLRNSDGTFQATRSSQTAGFVDSIGLGDFNEDGKTDFAIVEGVPAGGPDNCLVELKLGDGSGGVTATKTYPFPVSLRQVVVGDFDLDFHLDVAISNQVILGPQVTSVYVMRGNGDGTLQGALAGTATSSKTEYLFGGDYNRDGRPDLLATFDSYSNLGTFLNTAVAQNAIRGRVWNDDNRDQLVDNGETGLGGRTVYVDANDNAILDAGEQSTTTRADGTYELSVADGTYTIREALPAGWVQSSPSNFGVGTKPASYSVQVSGHQVRSGWDFGAYSLGTISGRVWNDFNANGVMEQFESTLSGRTVFADGNGNGALDAGEVSSVTASDGLYRLNLPAAGTYVVRQVLPAGWYATNGSAFTVTASPANPVSGINFGTTQLGSLSGRVYYDLKADGISNDSDPGLSGFTVFLDGNYNGTRDAWEAWTTTDAQGNYAFANLFPGPQSVRLIKPAGWQQISPALPPGATDAALDTRVAGGADASYSDFGLIRPSYVSGRVFKDTNADGVQQAGEPGLASWFVFLDLDRNGISDIGEPFTQTDAQGNYTLRAPYDGTFDVRVVRPSGWQSTSPAGGSLPVTMTAGATLTGRDFGATNGSLNNAGFKPPLNLKSGGTFSFVNPWSVAVGDFNNDGKADFAVANNSADVTRFLGNGAGAFMAASAGFGGSAMRALIAVDLNGDNKTDLVTANQDTGDVSVLLGKGDGTFQTHVDYAAVDGAYCLVSGDFNGDGKMDVAVGGKSSNQIAILKGNGNGTFQAATFATADVGTVGLAVGDFNGDNKTDLAAVTDTGAGGNGSLAILKGNGNGTFQTATLLTTGIVQPDAVAVGDFNKDLKADVAIANEYSDVVRVMTGKGDGTFNTGVNYGVGSTPSGLATVDVDADGWLDLAVACRSDGTSDISGGISILRNHKDGTFETALTSTAHTSPVSVAWADFNGDGLADLAAANSMSDDASVMINSRNLPTGGAGGSVFSDTSNDGVRDPGEVGVAGIVVYADLNNSGGLDAGEPNVTTDANGQFLLPPLAIGNYTVRLVSADGWAQTLPAGGAGRSFTLGAGQSVELSFGLHDTKAPVIFAGGLAAGVGQMNVQFVFNEFVGTSVPVTALQLTNLSTGVQIPASSLEIAYAQQSFAVSFTYTGGALPDGLYQATLPAGSAVDASNNPLQTRYVAQFAVLGGDADGNQLVNFDDLLIVAKNYNRTGATRAQGDFTGDGVVNFDDLLVLAKNYNKSLSSPAGTEVVAASVAPIMTALTSQSGTGMPSVLQDAPTTATVFSTTRVARPAPPKVKPAAHPKPKHR